MENMETEDEPITDGFSPEYVKEEIAKLMVYKVQAYEQLIVIDKLREALKWFVEKYPLEAEKIGANQLIEP